MLMLMLIMMMLMLIADADADADRYVVPRTLGKEDKTSYNGLIELSHCPSMTCVCMRNDRYHV